MLSYNRTPPLVAVPGPVVVVAALFSYLHIQIEQEVEEGWRRAAVAVVWTSI